ncbi:hypothetical protein N7495_006810 [Penicillium taxi]|uniref:uncharacterized protein n=1 Tax=Penicillium taxi TaxID=168475 RepID=UPI00254503C9|nr:uncharacterized protein N7495_006810 [Penicillium taxi]KAJ5895119.1 hypothetical protein N7495_006810 [Penicillium taxi]
MPLPDLSFTLDDFDPEHEALASTREMGSPELPEEPDYKINSSTLERAFPDFSSDDEDADLSDPQSDLELELGRAAAKAPRRLDDSRDSIMTFQNSVRSSSPAIRFDYPTPQKNVPSRGTGRRAASENLRRDAQLRRASQAQKEHMNPQSKIQRDQRRTLSDMHAKVRENYDGSFLGDDRPTQIDTKTRSTRFANPSNSQEIAEAVERASGEAYARELRKANANGTPRVNTTNNMHTNNTAGDTTRNSFLLPDLPNISELVSGVYEDGTPVFTRQNNKRSTRFAAPSRDVADISLTREHIPLDAIPIPEDEKALFVSLRLLQDKVSELEMFKSDAEKRESKVIARRIPPSRRRNLGIPINTPFMIWNTSEISSALLPITIVKHEATILALQNQLDISERKAEVQDAAVKRLSQEREAAISELGVSYLEARELKTENEELRAVNAELKSQLTRFVSKKIREETVESESSRTVSDVDDSQSQVYTERSGDLSRSTRDVTSKSTRKSKDKERSRSKVSGQVDREIGRLEQERAEEALFTLDIPMPKRSSSSKHNKAEVSRQSVPKVPRKLSNTGKQRVKRVVVEEFTEQTDQSKTSDIDDLTLLSVIDENEISRLRKTLEDERLLRRQRRAVVAKEPTTTDTVNTTRQSILKAPAPRKSSLREPKTSIPRPASAMGDITTRSIATTDGDNSLTVPIADRPRRHSDHSIAPTPQRKKYRNVDMTSAFILPDITLSRAEQAASNPTRLPEATKRALDTIAQHHGKNCVVCKNVLPNDGPCDHQPVKVPTPVPVSERMPKPTIQNEDPTMRPSQDPAVALATVLKSLEDELSHLKMSLATYQSVYNKLDASLGKRQRKTVMEKIETLLREIDMKSDQIYALYDVLEGQKGHGMTEQEMEMTLESIGIDIGQVPDLTGNTDKSGLLDLDDEGELPWEGIESTAELSGRI